MSSVDLSRCRLYGILDLGYVSATDAVRVAGEMIEGGVDLIQLRAKGHETAAIATLAAEVHEITRERNVPLVINDHPAIARQIGAEGVHVGQDDLSVAEARQIAGGGCCDGRVSGVDRPGFSRSILSSPGTS